MGIGDILRRTPGGAEDALLRLTKQRNDRFVQERRSVDWLCRSGGETSSRTPQPCKREYSLRAGFRIGGRTYRRVEHLRAKVLDRDRRLYRDIYDRPVAEIAERFPCFDSYDYASEDRYYHWLYLTEAGKLYLVYYEDGGDAVAVTEDVGEIRGSVWREMARLGWVKDVEVQTIAGPLGFSNATERKT